MWDTPVLLWGGPGRDDLYGDNGRQVLRGGGDSDSIAGENPESYDGNDLIYGGAGDDFLTGDGGESSR